MKVLVSFEVFLCFCKFSNCDIFEKFNLNLNENSALINAVNEIVTRSFPKNISVSTTNLITPDKTSTRELSDFKEKLLMTRSRSFDTMFRQDSSQRLSAVPGRKKRSCVFLISNFAQFLEIYEKIKPEVFKIDGIYLLALINGEIKEIEAMFKLLWKYQIHNVAAIYEVTSEVIHLKTFMPFNSEKCDDTTPIVVNKYIKGSFVNSVENLFTRKITNLHNCSVRVSISNNFQPNVLAHLLPNGSYDLSGRDIMLINALSKSLNFYANYTFIGHGGYFLQNGSAKGPLKSLLTGEADFSVSNWWMKTTRLELIESSSAYFSDQVAFIVPPGNEFSSFEKLAYPFKFSLWALIFLYFLVGVVVIFIVGLRSTPVRFFVFGTNVNYPYLNMIIAFIGGTQHKLPKRNFARFLLMIFLMYSIVMRTLYQGAYYRLLQTNKRHKEVQTIDEMIEKDFTFYIDSGWEETFDGSDAISKRFERKKLNFYVIDFWSFIL